MSKDHDFVIRTDRPPRASMHPLTKAILNTLDGGSVEITCDANEGRRVYANMATTMRRHELTLHMRTGPGKVWFWVTKVNFDIRREV